MKNAFKKCQLKYSHEKKYKNIYTIVRINNVIVMNSKSKNNTNTTEFIIIC